MEWFLGSAHNHFHCCHHSCMGTRYFKVSNKLLEQHVHKYCIFKYKPFFHDAFIGILPEINQIKESGSQCKLRTLQNHGMDTLIVAQQTVKDTIGKRREPTWNHLMKHANQQNHLLDTPVPTSSQLSLPSGNHSEDGGVHPASAASAHLPCTSRCSPTSTLAERHDPAGRSVRTLAQEFKFDSLQG